MLQIHSIDLGTLTTLELAVGELALCGSKSITNRVTLVQSKDYYLSTTPKKSSLKPKNG